MSIFLDRIDSAPIANSDFDMQILQWIWVLVDTLNENIGDIQNAFNLFIANSYTDVEITNLDLSGQLLNGVILYDSVNNVYVGKQNGSLIKFDVSPYP